MANVFLLTYCALFFATGSNAIFWDDFRMTFSKHYPEEGFTPLPRTVHDAKAHSWVNSSEDCHNGGKFNGFRYLDSTDKNPDFVSLLFDVQGTIAGFQAVIPLSDIPADNDIQWDEIPMYRRDDIDGVPYYTITVYLINPNRICKKGRPNSALQTEGTGTDVYFQNGPTPKSVVHIPHERSVAIAGDYGNNACIPMMGWHCYHEVRQWGADKCQKLSPALAIYDNDGHLNVFSFNIPLKAKSPKYETETTSKVIDNLQGVTGFPDCVYTLNKRIGSITTLHVYLQKKPWMIRCAGV